MCMHACRHGGILDGCVCGCSSSSGQIMHLVYLLVKARCPVYSLAYTLPIL